MEKWSVEMTLNSPMTKMDWAKITDENLNHTNEITFTTPSGNEVLFRKVVRGKWDWDELHGFLCSECSCWIKNQPTLMGKPMFLFCPICGAEMEEKK